MAKLNKTEVDKLTPGDPDYFVWDETLPGFGVRVWPSGTKVYVAQYRAGGRTRRHKIGTHGAITCEQARRMARAVWAKWRAATIPPKNARPGASR